MILRDAVALLRAVDGDLAAGRFETARRRCAAVGAHADRALRLRWIDSLLALGDLDHARDLVDLDAAEDEDGEGALRRVEILLRRSAADSHRTSRERSAGWCLEEYQAHYRGLATAALAQARERLGPEEARIRALERRMGLADGPTRSPPSPPQAAGAVLRGVLRHADGRPVGERRVVVGVYDPTGISVREWDGGMGHEARLPACTSAETCSDTEGQFRFDGLPAGRAWLAVVLDEDEDPVRTRFLPGEHDLQADSEHLIELTLQPWRSAPQLPLPAVSDAAAVVTWRFANPFRYAFPVQAVHLDVDPDRLGHDLLLYWHDEPERLVPHQWIDDRILVMVGLEAFSDRLLVASAATADQSIPALTFQIVGEDAIVGTGAAEFRIPWSEAASDAAPIAMLRRPEGLWRGQGRWCGAKPVARSVQLLDHGPLALRFTVDYRLADGGDLRFTCTAHRDQSYLLVHEQSSAGDQAFEFSLAEFLNGRGYLHWCRESGSAHWSTLATENRELARLQESVAWWIPPCGFAYAMGEEGLDDPDLVAVFTARRGEWRDELFESLCHGPSDEQREWDWPYPEMVGSTVSMITAATTDDGDARFRFAGFNGERIWGLMVGGFGANDGPDRQLGLVQHACSSPRLEDFVTWQLDHPDDLPRPCCVTTRDQLGELRRRSRDPAWQRWWEGVATDSHCAINEELIALLEPDPVTIWRSKMQLTLHLPVRAQRTLKGRDHGDMYSPVGGRPITPMAQRYDLIVGTGVFAPDEEREARACLLLMGHAYLDPDHMNWRFGGRNANFEADRVDIVGTVGLTFRGNHDADRFIDHAIERMAQSINAYCTPGSGKWYENPACYYVHAMTCRLHLGILLARHGLLDPARVPRLGELLRWATLLITPPYPEGQDEMRDGCSLECYRQQHKIRHIPPIGDHAQLGRRVPECLAVMGSALQASDPDLVDELWWTYLAGGGSGGHFSQFALLFTGDTLPPLPEAQPDLPSRRLEGFGAVMRHRFGSDDEGYLLFKMGPGGYRYHRSEGGLIWFEHGVPLLFDGGEAGETWRHSTLARGDTHLPLCAGHLERWHFGDGLDFSQGVNPAFVRPGEPVYLSDDCHHGLVAEAQRRFHEPCPENRRSLIYVHGDYLLLHDALDLADDEAIHWHLQVVGDAATSRADGWLVEGRFGVDLQVLLPDQRWDEAADEHLPILDYQRSAAESFGMRHLRLTARRPEGFCALLRPLVPGRKALRARVHGDLSRAAVGVAGDGIDDLHLLAAGGHQVMLGGVELSGNYASIRRRSEALYLALHGAGRLCVAGLQLASDGPMLRVCWRVDGSLDIHAEGTGRVEIDGVSHRVATGGLRLERHQVMDSAWYDIRESRFAAPDPEHHLIE